MRRIARLLTLCALLSLMAPSLRAAPESLNLLERELSAAQTDASRLPGFLESLVDSEVVLLTKRNVLAQESPDDIEPLVIPGQNDQADMVAVFTSPEMAHRVAATYPQYQYGIRTDFIWVLAHTAPGLGVTINPGWTLGMRIPSFGLLRMRERYSDRIDAALD